RRRVSSSIGKTARSSVPPSPSWNRLPTGPSRSSPPRSSWLDCETERRPGVALALRHERGAVQFQYPFRDRQSQSGAAARGGLLAAPEAVEDERQALFRDAAAGVAHA